MAAQYLTNPYQGQTPYGTGTVGYQGDLSAVGGGDGVKAGLDAVLSRVFGGSSSGAVDQTFLSPTQSPYLQNLWAQGTGLAGQQMGQVGPFASQLAGGLGQYGQQGLNQLGMGGQAMQPYMGPGFAQQQIGALGQQTQQFLGNALGQIGAQGVGSGGYGGTRQGVAEGQAIGDATRGFQSAASGLMQNDLARQQQAASTFGQQNMAGAMGQLGSLGSLFDLGMSPFSAQWQPLQGLAGAIGNPIMEQFGQKQERSSSGFMDFF